VTATDDGTQNSYNYDLLCHAGTPAIHVSGTFNSGTNTANEALTTDTNGLNAAWNCAHDPWIAPSAPVCTRGVVTPTHKPGAPASIPNFDASEQTQPFSTQYLDDQQRQILFKAQLQYAVNHPAAPVKIVDAPETMHHDCALCTVLGQTSTPGSGPADLAVSVSGPATRQTGLSGTYTVTIKNQGGSAAPVDLVIIFSGTLNQTDAVVAGAGLDCVVKAGDPGINQAVHCTSGSLAPGESATVVVQARGLAAGKGTLLATINASRSVTESSYDNNLVQLDVTVG
jgi:hypothetical protein